jgi:hypothetical protein
MTLREDIHFDPMQKTPTKSHPDDSSKDHVPKSQILQYDEFCHFAYVPSVHGTQPHEFSRLYFPTGQLRHDVLEVSLNLPLLQFTQDELFDLLILPEEQMTQEVVEILLNFPG